jgi:hypothetical protein
MSSAANGKIVAPPVSTNCASNSCSASSGRGSSAHKGGDRFDRQERIGAGRRVKDGEPVTLVMDDVMEPAIKSVRRARRYDRAVEVEQRRRDAGREAIGQAALVVGAFVNQRQMIPPASAGARGVVERPESNGAATEKAYFAEHAVDPTPGNALSAETIGSNKGPRNL